MLAAYSSRWHVWALSLFVAAYFFKSQDQLFRQHRSTGGRNASWLLPGILAITVPLILAFGLFFAESLRNQARFQAVCRLTEEGRYAEAEREFRACQKFSPDDGAIFWNLALIYENLGDIERAKKELRASLARYPNSTEVQEYLAELEARKPEPLAGERPPG